MKKKYGFFLLVVFSFIASWVCYPENIFSQPVNSLWTMASRLPVETASFTSEVYKNIIYVIGGSGLSLGNGSVIKGILDTSNYNVIYWNYIESLQENIIWHSSVRKDRYIFEIGGSIFPSGIATAQDAIYRGEINDDGNIDWTLSSVYPIKFARGSAGIVGNSIISIGGSSWLIDSSNNYYFDLSNTYSASISATGNLSSWKANASLPEPREGLHVITTETDLYALGGRFNGVSKNNVYRAIFDSDGNVINWENQPTLPYPIYRPQAVRSGKYIFVIGGFNERVGNLRDIFYSRILTDGNLSDWTTLGEEMKLPKATCCGTVVALDGYFYLIGGYNNTYTDEVYSMKIPDFALETVPDEKTPMVFLPGMMASWNKSLLHFGENAPNNEWKIAPYVNNYDNIFRSLELAGYIRDIDYFIYAYDWRRSIASNAADLENYIDEKGLTKVNIVGHSMGGLLARTYAFKNKDKINKLVTIGSPHSGSAKAYYTWEGADLTGLSNTEKIALRIYLRAVSNVFTNDVETIQKEVPSLKEILPVDSYLIKLGGGIVPVNEMKQQNNFLSALNSLELNDLPDTVSIYGSGLDTWRYLNVVNRSSWDRVWDKWEDGKPIDTINSTGDETVLVASAILPTPVVQKDIGNVFHGDLLSNISGQKATFEALGLSSSVFETKKPFKYEKAIIAAMGSAATFEIIDPQGDIHSPINNVLAIDQANSGTYTLKIIPESLGTYTLYLGRFLGDDEAWEEFDDTNEDKLIQFYVNWDDPNLGTNPITRAKNKIGKLRLLINDGQLNSGNISAFLTQLNLIENELDDLENTNENRQAWMISFTDSLVKRIQSDWKGADENYKQMIIGILRKIKLDVAEAVGNLV